MVGFVLERSPGQGAENGLPTGDPRRPMEQGDSARGVNTVGPRGSVCVRVVPDHSVRGGAAGRGPVISCVVSLAFTVL